MQIFINGFSGKSITIYPEHSSTIHQIKQMIQAKEGIHPDEFRLIFQGKTLNDTSRTLEEYSVIPESIIHMVGYLRGRG